MKKEENNHYQKLGQSMKFALLFIVTVCLFLNATAQNYKKIFYKDQTIENADVKVIISDAVATPAGIKFKIRVINKTNDYIIFKPSESSFKIAGEQSNPVEKELIIRPNNDNFKVIDLKGKQYMVPSNYEFKLDGIYKVSFNSPGIAVADFKLPPSQNDFKAGGFTVILDKFKKETDKTDARFIAEYTGDKIGIVEVNKVGVKMPDGKEYANYNDKKPIVFLKGNKDDFTLAWKEMPKTSGDMQKADMLIIWRDAFKEGRSEKIAVQILNIIFDQELTNEKGK
ncbi:MAG: hypothetical protein H0W84_04035 [Bacteroidetes bacterium]|nr:hypothetical protein [Bacteroidota bacterium]